jgi:hypothetical protein
VLDSVSGQDRDAVEGLLAVQADIIAGVLDFQRRKGRIVAFQFLEAREARVPSETAAAA